MDTFGNALLGILFLIVSFASTFLMYRLWGYPFDHDKLRSSAPPRLLLTHRLLGYAYAAIYLILMFQMLPRLWSYEVEFPPRTVAHFLLGMSIGVILLVKISIVRFFKYLESTLIPALGTLLLVCTFLLVGISVPFALKEYFLHRSTVGGTAFSQENIDRVSLLLPRAGFPEDMDLKNLSTVEEMKKGRDVLLDKCVQCHDLRTVLIRPRTPKNWVETVQRMAGRAVFNPITGAEQWRVATYLIAISPELQRSFGELKKQEQMSEAHTSLTDGIIVAGYESAVDPAAAAETFEDLCTQCHGLKNLERSPPENGGDVLQLVERMMDNGLEATDDELREVVFHLTSRYTEKR